MQCRTNNVLLLTIARENVWSACNILLYFFSNKREITLKTVSHFTTVFPPEFLIAFVLFVNFVQWIYWCGNELALGIELANEKRK